MMRPLYFARDKADTRSAIEQCKKLIDHLESTGFEVWVTSSDTNYLKFYGKDKKRP